MKTLQFLEQHIELLKEDVKEDGFLHNQLLKCIHMYARVSKDYPKVLQLVEEQIEHFMDRLKRCKQSSGEHTLHSRLFEYTQMHKQLSEEAAFISRVN